MKLQCQRNYLIIHPREIEKLRAWKCSPIAAMISRMTNVLACGNGIVIFFLLCFNFVSGTTNEPIATSCNHAHLKCGLIAGVIGCISTFIPFLISHFLTYVRQHIEDIWTAPRTSISSGYEEIGSFHSTDSKSYFRSSKNFPINVSICLSDVLRIKK